MMTKQEYERLAHYLSLHTPDEEAPAQIVEHRRVLELEAQVTKLEAALQEIIECDTAEGLEGDNEFFDGVSVAETALKAIASAALGR